MGLGSIEIRLLIKLKKAGHIAAGGSVIEMGAQQLSDSFLEAREELQQVAEVFAVKKPCPLPSPLKTDVLLHGNFPHLSTEAPRSSLFWEWLGFTYASFDIDGSPGSIPVDLNYDDAPANIHGAYQIVTNCGTTEHLVNQLNAFKVVHELTALEGVMIHNLPSQGMFNHGLVNYNPKFFWMLARSNGYELLHMNFSDGQTYYPLPQNIMDCISTFDPTAVSRLKSYQATDNGLFVCLKKKFDIPFVAPLDVPTGCESVNKALEERYWTVFKPDAFHNPDVINEAKARAKLSELERQKIALEEERDYLDKVVKSALAWQKRSWFKRVFHRWRAPKR